MLDTIISLAAPNITISGEQVGEAPILYFLKLKRGNTKVPLG